MRIEKKFGSNLSNELQVMEKSIWKVRNLKGGATWISVPVPFVLLQLIGLYLMFLSHHAQMNCRCTSLAPFTSAVAFSRTDLRTEQTFL